MLCSGYQPPGHIDKGEISGKFDIFSLGVVIIKIVSGPNGYPNCLDQVRNHISFNSNIFYLILCHIYTVMVIAQLDFLFIRSKENEGLGCRQHVQMICLKHIATKLTHAFT